MTPHNDRFSGSLEKGRNMQRVEFRFDAGHTAVFARNEAFFTSRAI